MSLPFYIVYSLLRWLSDLTGLSYVEVNVIVYFVIIPAIYLALIDRILRKPLCLSAFAIFLLIAYFRIPDFSTYSETLFAQCVSFLFFFSRFGISYDAASVLICVLAPLCLLIILCYFAFPASFRRLLPTITRAIDLLRLRKNPSADEK